MSVITDGGFHPVGGQIGYGPGVPSENGFITVEGKTWTDQWPWLKKLLNNWLN